MAKSTTLSFRGGSVTPGQGINEGDINPLVVNRKLQDGTPQQQTYDPLLANQQFDFGRVKFRKNGTVVGSYDPFDSDKNIDLPEDATVTLVSVDAADLNTVLSDILSNAKLPVLQDVGGSTDKRYDYSGKDTNGDFIFYRITETEVQLAVVSYTDGTISYTTLDLNNGGSLSFAQIHANRILTAPSVTKDFTCELEFKRGNHISIVSGGADDGCVHLKAGTYYCSAVVDIEAIGTYTPEYSTNRFRMFGKSFFDNSDHSYNLSHLMSASLIVTVPTGGQNYRLDFTGSVDDLTASVTSLSIIQLHDAEAPTEGHEYTSANACIDIDNVNDVIEFKYADKLMANASDATPETLAEKIAGQYGIIVNVQNIAGPGQPAFYKLFIEPVTDPDDPNALAKLSDLKALAFKDKVNTSDIDDDAVTADKVKNNETLPVNVTGYASHLRQAKCKFLGSETGYRLMAELSPSINNYADTCYIFNVYETLDQSELTSGILKGVLSIQIRRDNSIYRYSSAYKGSALEYIGFDLRVDPNTNGINLYATKSGHVYAFTVFELLNDYDQYGAALNPTLHAGSELLGSVSGTVVTPKFTLLKGSDGTIPLANNSGVGSPTRPVYVDENGSVQPCSTAQYYVAIADFTHTLTSGEVSNGYFEFTIDSSTTFMTGVGFNNIKKAACYNELVLLQTSTTLNHDTVCYDISHIDYYVDSSSSAQYMRWPLIMGKNASNSAAKGLLSVPIVNSVTDSLNSIMIRVNLPQGMFTANDTIDIEYSATTIRGNS